MYNGNPVNKILGYDVSKNRGLINFRQEEYDKREICPKCKVQGMMGSVEKIQNKKLSRIMVCSNCGHYPRGYERMTKEEKENYLKENIEFRKTHKR